MSNPTPTPTPSRRSRLVFAAAVAAALAGFWGATHCIESQCLRDEDCASGEMCNESTGACVAVQCTEDSTCGTGRICEEHSCVTGCRTADQCGADQQCYDSRCVDVGTECPCPMAPEFCLPDLNPNSETSGTEVCLPEEFPDGVLLFFGSARCGHCHAIFTSLQERQAALEGLGFHPRLLWVQLKSVSVLPADIAALLPEVDDPLVLDTAELDLWGRYAADWYYAVMVDSHGCLTGRWGPLSPTQIEGAVGEEIVSRWREAASPECPEISAETTDGGETSAETTDGGETSAETTSDADAGLDAADVPVEVDAGLDTDETPTEAE